MASESTTIPVKHPTRDLFRAIKPQRMGYDEFVLELLLQFNEEELELTPDEVEYTATCERLMDHYDVAEYDVEFDRLPDENDVTPVST